MDSKEKQKHILHEFKYLEDKMLKDGSPTDFQIGRMTTIQYFIEKAKHIINVPNTYDGGFIAEMLGSVEVAREVNKILRKYDPKIKERL